MIKLSNLFLNKFYRICNMRRFIKPISVSVVDNPDIIDKPCVNLGTRIKNQMYAGVDNSNSTLVSGQYDDDDSWDVDPACDMRTDRFTYEVKNPVPVVESPVTE